MRRDLNLIRPGDEISTELKLLTARRTDLVCDRTRVVNRLRAQLSGYFPALERALDMGNAGPLTLLTGYRTPAAIRRLGRIRLESWLRNRKVRGADRLGRAAAEAAERQHTAIPGEDIAAELVGTLAHELITLNGEIAQIDRRIENRFRARARALVLATLMESLLARASLSGRACEGLRDLQPLRRVRSFGPYVGVGGVEPLRRQQAEVEGVTRDPLRGVLGSVGPQLPVDAPQFDPEGFRRRLHPAHRVGEVPCPYADPYDVTQPRGRLPADPQGLGDVLAVRPRLHDPGGGHARRAHRGAVPGDAPALRHLGQHAQQLLAPRPPSLQEPCGRLRGASLGALVDEGVGCAERGLRGAAEGGLVRGR